MSRRRTRKRRNRRRSKPAPAPAPVVPERPVDWPRLRAKFSSMKGRGVTLGFVACGPVVDAKSPAEMIANTEAALVAAVVDEPKN